MEGVVEDETEDEDPEEHEQKRGRVLSEIWGPLSTRLCVENRNDHAYLVASLRTGEGRKGRLQRGDRRESALDDTPIRKSLP